MIDVDGYRWWWLYTTVAEAVWAEAEVDHHEIDVDALINVWCSRADIQI